MDVPGFVESRKYKVLSLSDSETEGIEEELVPSPKNADDHVIASSKPNNNENKKVLRKRKRAAPKPIDAGLAEDHNYQKRLVFSLSDSETEEIEQKMVPPPKNADDNAAAYSKPKNDENKKVLRKRKRAAPKPIGTELVEGDECQKRMILSLTESDTEENEQKIDLICEHEDIEKVTSKPMNDGRKILRKRKTAAPKPPAKKQKPNEEEQCSICLKNISANIGNPSHCKHRFCLLCLKKWAKDHSNCPLDRIEFSYINVVKKISGKVDKRIGKHGELIKLANCGNCHSNDRQNWLVPCDLCNVAFHVGCLPNPANVSISSWKCINCESNESVPIDISQQKLNAMNRSFALQLFKVHCQILEKDEVNKFNLSATF